MRFPPRAKIILTALLLVFLAAAVCFIWSNSLESAPQSAERSQTVTEIVRPVLEPVVGVGKVTDHFVRKLAHFTEFAALGAGLSLLLLAWRRMRLRPALLCLLSALFVAAADETIQRFTGRGPRLQDVLLDFSGALAGFLAVFLAASLLRALFPAKKK